MAFWRSVMMAIVLASAGVAQSARAQEIVHDPSNLAQNVLQAARALEQIRNQVRQIDQGAAMLRQNPLQLAPEFATQLEQARALFAASQGLAFEMERLGDDVEALYPETWEAYDLAQVLAQSRAWQGESRQSLERAMRAQVQSAHAIAAAQTQIDRALAASRAAEGQTSAMQAGNQLLGVTAVQITQIHALLTAQGRALETERLERSAREARSREISRRAFPTEAPVARAPARSAF